MECYDAQDQWLMSCSGSIWPTPMEGWITQYWNRCDSSLKIFNAYVSNHEVFDHNKCFNVFFHTSQAPENGHIYQAFGLLHNFRNFHDGGYRAHTSWNSGCDSWECGTSLSISLRLIAIRRWHCNNNEAI